MKSMNVRGGRYALPAFFFAALITVSGTGMAADMTAQPLPAVEADRLYKATMVKIAKAGDRLVSVGDYGVIQVSEDNGASWRQVASPVSRMLTDIEFIDDSTGWAIGYDQVIMRTDDGGLTWTLQNFAADPGWPLYDIFFMDEHEGFAIGERGTFLSTVDGGETWNEVDADITGLGMHLNDIIALGSGCLLMVGEKGVIASSVDRGDTWNLLSTPYVGSWFGAMPYGEKGAILYGLRGNVYVTENVHGLVYEDLEEWDEYGRETIEDNAVLAEMGWTRLENDRVDSFFGGHQLDNDEALLVGVNGSIMRTDLSGERLVPVENPEDLQLGDAVLVQDSLVTVGVGGINRIPYR